MRSRALAGVAFVLCWAGSQVAAACPPGHQVDGDDCDWVGTPGYVSGESTYSAGEFIYSDYVHDDAGADLDTVQSGEMDPGNPVTGTIWVSPDDPTSPRFGSTGDNLNARWRYSGDFAYPPRGTDTQQDLLSYYDVADILELRVTADAAQVHYLIRLGALRNADDAVVGIGIDADHDYTTGGAEWPRGANVRGQLGYDYFLTVWGTGAELVTYDAAGTAVSATPVPVAANLDKNLIEVSIPRPAGSEGAIWRHYVGSGLWDPSTQSWRTVEPTTTRTVAVTSIGSPLFPNLYNLLFRPWEPNTWWRETKQAEDLARNDISEDFADVELAKLDSGATDPPSTSTGLRNVQYETVPLGDGEGEEANAAGLGAINHIYKGPTQPAMLFLPSDYWTRPEKSRRFMFFYHCLNCNQNIWPLGVEDAASQHRTHVWGDAPLGTEHIQAIADEFDLMVAGALQRGEAGAGPFGADYEERDVRDILATFRDRDGITWDPDRVIYSGMSRGGSQTNRLMTLYPDEIAAAVAYSAASTPARVGNIRNLFYASITGDTGLDSAASTSGRGAADTLASLGYRHCYIEYLSRAHDFNLVYESWPIVKGLIAGEVRDPNPARVTYQLDASTENAALGLDHSKAYWVKGLALAADSGTIDATAWPLAWKLPTGASRLIGYFTNTFTGNSVYVSWLEYADLTGRSPADFEYGWLPDSVTVTPVAVSVPAEAGQNGFEATLAGLAAATLETARMGILPSTDLSARATTDGAATLALQGSWGGSETVTLSGGATAVFADGSYTITFPASGSYQIAIAVGP